MKGGLKKSIFTTVISGALLPVILLLGGCRMLFEEPINPDPLAWGMGRLSVAVSGSQALSVANPGRTMLALSPEFSRYELIISPNPDSINDLESSKTYPSDTGSFQLTLDPAEYTISAIGYTGGKPSARTWDSVNRVIETKPVTVSAGTDTEETLTLRPYMDAEVDGTLQYSINWDGVGQIPTQAELLVEQYNDNDTPDTIDDDHWDPISVSLITGDASAGSRRGTVLLLRRDLGLVKQAGSLQLPPGEYRLTATVTMDGPWPPVSRTDIAHIYSNLITPAAFFYGAGDLTVTNPGLDTASGFITKFNFKKPGTSALIAVTSVVGSAPGPDGTRLIMVMVPADTDLAHLTPVVECAPGAQVTSPAPSRDPIDGSSYWSEADYTNLTFWTATGANGVSQQYTVVVSKAPSGDARIYSFVFDGYPDYPGTVIQPPTGETSGGSITVLLPNGTSLAGLKPQIMHIGRLSPASGEENDFSNSSTTPVNYTVTSDDELTVITYPVTVLTKGPDTDTGIFDFVITNVPRAKVIIGTKPRADGKIPIVVSVPYATEPFINPNANSPDRKTNLRALIPKITLSSQTSVLSPSANGTTDYIDFSNQNDYQEAEYLVTAAGNNSQIYVVLVARDIPYYYVKATGDDTDPDYYNGSESAPLKTLAFAVAMSIKHNVDHIFVIGTLNDTSETGAYRDNSATFAGDTSLSVAYNHVPSSGEEPSVFNIKGTGLIGSSGNTPRHIYITGVGSNAVLQGASDKRVISITGGAHITFENITIQGGGSPSYMGNGGGLYVGDGSKVVWKSGVITSNTAKSGGGLYLEDKNDTRPYDSEFDFIAGSINGNTASSKAIIADDFDRVIEDTSIAGGGGVYVYGDALFWQAGGAINGNTAAGSGGGVLVNGSTIPNEPTPYTMPDNFIMSDGSINGNTSNASVWPGGGGGVYVAKGAFEMLNGEIAHNNAPLRQGGGVFVWSKALFTMDGNSSVTGNSGVGSAKAICSRGITEMRGNAQADSVYIWNYSKGAWNRGVGDQFTLTGGARISGLVLAFADNAPAATDNRNYINIVSTNGEFFTPGTDRITTIDLESHLVNGSFAKNVKPSEDWGNRFLVFNGNNEIPADVLKRFPLGTFTSGGAVQTLSTYKLDSIGRLQQ
jgi:hypothetical protein